MKKIYLLIFILVATAHSFSQDKAREFKVRAIGFYNVENLFDTINNTSKKDELSPIMEIKHNRSKIYWKKIDKLAEVISKIGKEKTNTSPAILGLVEIENDTVIKDLVRSEKLIQKQYSFIHFDSPDSRGIDVALLYQPKYFTPTHYEVFDPNIYIDNIKIKTRDILWVQGYLDDEKINVIVNHWPSRRGGEAKSSPLREKAAYKVTQIISKIRENDDNAKIIIMGDFNDDPTNISFKKVLKTKKKKTNVAKNDIYNPYEKMFSKGLSTLGYRDNINLFDQILITEPLIANKKNNDYSTYKMLRPGIFNKRFLTQKEGKYKGYPYRSFSNNQFTGGYSDHYPVYLYLIKEKKK